MSFEIKKAARKRLKLKIGLQGASGSGKTYSALKLAHGICGDWEKIFFIDTENESASYYCDLGPFNHLAFNPPYHPERYIEAIDACIAAGAEVIIIDSMSHEWDGRGGCLELHEDQVRTQKYGNKFTAWSAVTPRHNAFVDHVRISDVHVIACTRAKQDYALETDGKGKAVPKKVGLKGVQRDGLDYELGLVFELDMDHMAFAGKDRTGLFAGKPKHIITEETGKQLLKWANSGSYVDRKKPEKKEPEPEHYTGTDKQRISLFTLLKEYKVTDAEQQKAIASHVEGMEVSEIPFVIDNFVKTGEL